MILSQYAPARCSVSNGQVAVVRRTYSRKLIPSPVVLVLWLDACFCDGLFGIRLFVKQWLHRQPLARAEQQYLFAAVAPVGDNLPQDENGTEDKPGLKAQGKIDNVQSSVVPKILKIRVRRLKTGRG